MTQAVHDAGGAILTATGIAKSFGGVHALRGVDLTLRPQSVLAIAGENGAGKSTLIKTLTGVYQPDEGTIVIDGAEQSLTPARARELGVAAVAQELSVLDHQSVADNIFLGREPRGRFGLTDRQRRDGLAQELLTRLGLSISPRTMVRDLTLAEKQMVEIAKAMSTSPRILILDEPTSGLREGDVETLLKLIRQLRDAGTSIVLVTHRMSEMFEVSDAIMVLKDGKHVGTRPTADTTEAEIVKLMVGRELAAVYPPKASDQPSRNDLDGLGFLGTGHHGARHFADHPQGQARRAGRLGRARPERSPGGSRRTASVTRQPDPGRS